MVDTSPILDQVACHFYVVVDDCFHERGPQVFVLGIHISTSLSEKKQSTLIAMELHRSGFRSNLEFFPVNIHYL